MRRLDDVIMCELNVTLFDQFTAVSYNSAFQVKMNDIILIGNLSSFLKHPSKSRLSFIIIEILLIALKDKQFTDQKWPKL